MIENCKDYNLCKNSERKLKATVYQQTHNFRFCLYETNLIPKASRVLLRD